MLWDPGSVEKDEEKGYDNAPVTPILVPLQHKTPTAEKNVPVLVPDVQDLKDQFQQQQNMLTQIKETLIQNESQLSSKGKQMELYANKLSQIRARARNTQGKKSSEIAKPSSPKMQKKSSRENFTPPEIHEGVKLSENHSKNRKGKVSELKKGLEENKIKFEQRTGKEQSEAKKIESLVEQLKMQLEERDKTIQDLQKTIEEPTPKLESLSKQKAKLKDSVASKTTQTIRNQPTEDSIEIIALQNKIQELEANVFDLEENLKEKESVIEARTQAVTLLSQDLSLKGKNALESLEETRQEMRTMQNNFIVVENQFKKDLSDKDNRIEKLEEKCKKLESVNFELSLKNAELQEKLVNMQTRYLEVDIDRKSMNESIVQGDPDDKLEELTKKINLLTKELDDRNKSMIKMKVEHRNKIKNLNKTLETLKGTSDEKAEIVRLCSLVEEFENIKTGLENRVAELEDEKGNLLLSILDVDDFKVSEKKLKDQINELEMIIKKQNEDLALHLKTISILEKENFDLIQSNQNQNILIESLQARFTAVETISMDNSSEDSRLKELNQRFQTMEEQYSRKLEELKGEHRKEIEILESYYNARGDALDKKALEEYRISTEINNIHVEEQIELLIKEKQQLLEKLKSLSGVSSTDSLTFEKMEHSDLKDDKETVFPLGEEVDITAHNSQLNRTFHLEKIVNDQQQLINDLQKTVTEEKEKIQTYQKRILELEETIKHLEDVNIGFKQQIEMSEANESGKNIKTNTNTKNRIKKIEMELSQSKRTIQEQSEKLNELNLKLQEKEVLLKKYTEKIEFFEKDDWDRQNHWKNTEDDIESVQELQKKCLSLENSLFELNEDCERLRKENIEVVHLLSEEKVKRRKLLEKLETKPERRDAENQREVLYVEERIRDMNRAVEDLEERIEKIESSHKKQYFAGETDSGKERADSWEISSLQEKLEWTNVVLTSKETEIFRLQNFLEDRNSSIEFLEMDLKEYKKKLEEKDKRLEEITEELKAKEVQLREISANFDKLQESVDVANQKTATNESQLKELLTTVKEMEGDVFKKESELQEIKGILAEKNLDMTNLRNRLEEVNSDLTYSYQEHLENMGKCLRDKESDYDSLLAEKYHLEEVNRTLVTEKEDIYNQKIEISNEKDKLKNILLEKEKFIIELNEKIQNLEKDKEGGKGKSQEMEDLKIKLKKLAANLKKKVQNEADLLKQVKEQDSRVEGLESELKEVTEKWTVEKTEKEKISGELSIALSEKILAENEILQLRDRIIGLEKEIEIIKMAHENQVQELRGQIQVLQEICNAAQLTEQEDKGKIALLEAKAEELSRLYQNSTLIVQSQNEVEKEKQILLQNLAETTAKYEEIKFVHSQILLEKSEMEKRFEEIQKICEESQSEKFSLQAKIQENLAVIESLEAELKKTQDQLKVVEEKFFHSEDRRLSLENKNEEMCKKIMENSENLITIDDLSIRIDELLKSEKSLQDCVKTLESGNAELKQSLDQIQTEKHNLEKELKASNDKMAVIGEELEELKNSDVEKNNIIRELNKEIERLKAENKQISSEFEKLNHDYEQFEIDFKENLENSQNIEKSLKHKIEELLNENANLTEKYNLISDKHHKEIKVEEEDDDDDDDDDDKGRENKKLKKRKFVTFRTDEVEYIKDLKNQLHVYDASLKQANEEIENLKAELFRERLRHEVSNVVAEAQEKVESLRSTPEKKQIVLEPVVEKFQKSRLEKSPAEERKFDANAYFGNEGEYPFLKMKSVDPQQNSELDSLVWDDGWGTEGHLEAEYLSTKITENEKIGNNYELKVKVLEAEMKTLQEENERLTKELQEQSEKYAKTIKKLKNVKAAHDKLLSEATKLKSSSFGDLDATIINEFKFQIESMEAKERELLKNLENFKLEKETLLKRINVLNAGNEKFLEMKERQDNEVEIWQRKNNELLKEITDLRQQLKEPQIPCDNILMTENRELKNKIEALEWKNCELSELLEEKQEVLERESQTAAVEKIMEEKLQLQKEIEELNSVRNLLEKKLFEEEKKNSTTIDELNEQLTALASENETLQDILGEMKKSADAAKKEKKQENAQESKIFDYFKFSTGNDLFPVVTPNSQSLQFEQNTHELEQLRMEINALKQRIIELENLLKQKEEELNKSWETYKEFKSLHQRLLETENTIRLRDEQINNLQLEKENEISCLKQNIIELENVLRLRDVESQHMKESTEKEIESLMARIQDLESTANLPDQFKTIELGEGENTYSGNENELFRQRIIDLESLLSQKDAEIQYLHETKAREIENFNQKIFQLKDTIRLREETLSTLQSVSRHTENDVDVLKRKILEMEEFARFKENEVQSARYNENQNLNQRIFELENMLRFKEENLHQMSVEIETLTEKTIELENVLSMKDEEIGHLMTRLNELEKSYNDSKLEIERLLNEEKLNGEEKFVEPFQNNLKIPVAFEVEALSRTLSDEKQKSENLIYELSEKENLLAIKTGEIQSLNSELSEMKNKLKEFIQEESKRSAMAEETYQMKAQLEKMVSNLQKELESSNLQLSVARRELEEFQNMKDEAMNNLKSQLFELETELVELREQMRTEVTELRSELAEKTKYYEEIIKERKEEAEKMQETIKELEQLKGILESEMEKLRKELESKEKNIEYLEQMLNEERKQMEEGLESREGEIADLKATLGHMQEEIGHFKNFERQVKELRVAQIKEAGSKVSVTPEGHPDLSDWSEHELAELSTRLQSDLDTALYMLHQRDVRCDELTFELMQLLEERDTLQLRLSTALRINEELRALSRQETVSSNRNLSESKDLIDQSNDRQTEKSRVFSEDLRQLANKISELHSVSYLRDKTVKDDSVQRHKEQMNLLSRVSDSDITLSRDVQSSPAVLLNWMRGKTTPKVMHI